MKRLIICCDGTWCSADKGRDCIPSNVALISRMIAPNCIDEKTGKTIEQVVYYQTGVGGGQMTRLNSVWQGATGAGLEENVTTAYHYLANNYLSGKTPDEDDEIFLFGFSRGAYTARALAGMVTEMGLLWPQELDKFPDLYKVYKERRNMGEDDEPINAKARKDSAVGDGENGHGSNDSTIMKNTGKFWKFAEEMANRVDRNIWGRIKQFHPDNDSEKSHIVHTIKIKVIGVWDTVGSRGLPDSLLTRVTKWNEEYGFHDTALNRKIVHAFQALSLDEHRGAFKPALWYLDRFDSDYGAKTDLKQCWFPGYHADIGGGTNNSSSKDDSGVDEITLAWMCDQVDGLLKFDEDACTTLLFSKRQGQWAEKITKDPIGWYRLPVAGGNVYRTPGQYSKKLENRQCAGGNGDNVTSETVHPSVRYRIDNSRDYDPPAFKKHSGWINTEGQAWRYETPKSENGNDGARWVRPEILGERRWLWSNLEPSREVRLDEWWIRNIEDEGRLNFEWKLLTHQLRDTLEERNENRASLLRGNKNLPSFIGTCI